MTNGGRWMFPRAIEGNSGFRWRRVVPEGLCDNSPAFQRREGIPKVSSPEGTVESGSSASLFQSSLRDLWGQAVPTPVGAGAACSRNTRKNFLHPSQISRCCDWPRRHSRAPAEVPLFQPSLRDSLVIARDPALKRRAILSRSLRDENSANSRRALRSSSESFTASQTKNQKPSQVVSL